MMELFSLPTLLFLFLLSFYLSIYFLLPKPPEPTTPPPKGFKQYPVIGHLPDFLHNRHRFLDWTAEVLARSPNNTAVFRRPNVEGVMTANPLVVEHMLKTNFENYPKGIHFLSILGDFLGQGIFNADGENWKHQRKTASYEFNTRSLRSFVMESVKSEVEARLIPILQRAAAASGTTNRILDMQDVLERFAFDNICKVAFNVDPGCLGGDATASTEFMQAFEEAATLSSGRFFYAVPFLYRIKKYFNLGSERRLMKSIATVHEFADNIIRKRLEKKSANTEEDLLSRFIGSTEDHSPEFLRDIVISIILAGRDTTSSTLTSFFWVVSSRPDITNNILQELKSIRARNAKHIDGPYSFDELREMHYLHAAISEALRLYPPVAINSKLSLNDDVLPDGTTLKKGWFLTYSPYAMGRMESIWGKDCLEFKPERWLENGVCKQETPFRFPAFHAGPRICLGREMAYIQMKSIAAAVVERFELDVLNGGECPEHIMSLTIRMKGGLPVLVKEKN
ncbi:hypothetical protein RHSIM_RhsimUnG0019200 [Rhododendron simsii]|uniref:Cytochrome P450 n=1 Tax=Rhododendron simsii TaxID=118357 RepID=A0A834L553_RHOSS|nr:hypothetical protein RHSIM_RhsimUnG0019200 [Rhododendron simsii]